MVVPLLMVSVFKMKFSIFDGSNGIPGRRIVSPEISPAMLPANAPGCVLETPPRLNRSLAPSRKFIVIEGSIEPPASTVPPVPISIVPPPVADCVPTAPGNATVKLLTMPVVIFKSAPASTSIVGNRAMVATLLKPPRNSPLIPTVPV